MRHLFAALALAVACLTAAPAHAQYQSSFSLSLNSGFNGNGAVSSQIVTDGSGNQFRVTTFANGQTIQQPLNANLTNGVPFVDPFASARFGGFGVGAGYGNGLGFGVGVGANRFNGFGVTGLNHVGVGFGGFNHHSQAIPFGNSFLIVPATAEVHHA